MTLRVLAILMLVTELSRTMSTAAQELPSGGYYADGAYYVPGDTPASAAAPTVTNRLPNCPVGDGVPSVYVASTGTMIRIYQFWPIGGDAPGFPYVPVYPSAAWC